MHFQVSTEDRNKSRGPSGILLADVFSRHHRKLRVLFGLSDVLLTGLTFEAAYRTRHHLSLEQVFALDPSFRIVLLGASMLIYLGLGTWLGVYDRLDSGNPRVILRETVRQCLLGTAALAVFQYLLRLEFPLSRLFLALFGVSVQTAVVYISYANELRLGGFGIPEATRTAALLRLRPIMMTALVAALGLLPAALSTGVGSDTQKPFALVIVGGLFSRLLISVFLMPVLYVLVAREDDHLEV